MSVYYHSMFSQHLLAAGQINVIIMHKQVSSYHVGVALHCTSQEDEQYEQCGRCVEAEEKPVCWWCVCYGVTCQCTAADNNCSVTLTLYLDTTQLQLFQISAVTMGPTFSSLFKQLFGMRDMRILMVGEWIHLTQSLYCPGTLGT